MNSATPELCTRSERDSQQPRRDLELRPTPTIVVPQARPRRDEERDDLDQQVRAHDGSHTLREDPSIAREAPPNCTRSSDTPGNRKCSAPIITGAVVRTVTKKRLTTESLNTTCNTGTGRYRLSGNHLTFSDVAYAVAACSDIPASIERSVKAVITDGVVQFEIEASHLTLRSTAGISAWAPIACRRRRSAAPGSWPRLYSVEITASFTMDKDSPTESPAARVEGA